MSLSILRWRPLFVLLLICTCGGCSYFQSASSDDDIDLTETDEEGKLDSEETTITPVAPVSPRRNPAFSAQTSEPSVKIGDRFPFSKSVEHRLTQVDKTGTRVSSILTEINLVLVVDKVVADGRRMFSVQFQRVRHVQDILGKRVEYTSDDPTAPIPQEASLYAGLIGNGFSFWIGPNNKISEVIGYADFIRRCLRSVPESSKTEVQQQFDPSKGLDGIANFIDDSIGLLPLIDDPKHAGVAVSKGAFWELEPKSCDVPVPVVTNLRCILKDVTSDSAEVLISGRMSGLQDPFVMHEVEGDLKVFVKGGNCTGYCSINPRSGLPTKSQIQRSLDLILELPDGQRIQQTKDTVTSFSQVMESSSTRHSSEPLTRQFGLQNSDGGHRTVVPTGFTRQN